MRKLWQISPKCRDGYAESPFSVPGVSCPFCDSWAGLRKLSIECPVELREELEFVAQQTPCLPLDKFNQYVDRWNAVISKHGHAVKLLPGDRFQPTIWQIPTSPQYEIYWPFLSIILHDNQVSKFREAGLQGVSFHQVINGKVGDDRTIEDLPEPENEPEDVLDQVPPVADPIRFGSFSEMLIETETISEYRDAESTLVMKCDACGYDRYEQSIDQKKQLSHYRRSRTIPNRYAPQSDIFLSHIFPGFVVSQRGFECLSQNALANCNVKELATC